MKVAGIIAEYNPFHKGHEYHIEETRKLTGADYVIAVMSGDYVQRGVPAIVDKYVRTRMALEHGADLVIEIPTVYATASAEYFAQAGIKILDSLGCVDYLSFGSEGATKENLIAFADLFLEEPVEYKNLLNQYLQKGYNFPKARELAAKDYLKDDYVDILNKANNILGVEYIKALKRLDSKIEPVIIERRGAGYAEDHIRAEQKHQSATAIRRNLKTFEKHAEIGILNYKEVTEGLTEGHAVEEFIERFFHHDYVDEEDLMAFFDYIFLMKESVLGKYFGMNLDLERRLRNLYKPGWTYADLIDTIHSKTMTDTALSRAILHIILQIKDKYFFEKASDIPVPYARILGFRRQSSALLKQIRQTARIDIIQKPVEGKYLYEKPLTGQGREAFERNEQAEYLFDIDIRSANLYEQIAAKKAKREPIHEYKRTVIIG